MIAACTLMIFFIPFYVRSSNLIFFIVMFKKPVFFSVRSVLAPQAKKGDG